MRIVSWNVNGLRTLKGYQPWYSHKSFAESLQHLQADIACFQECKLTRKTLLNEPSLGPSVCVVDGYQAYYNLHPEKGYSGTSVWTRNDVCMPLKAEEGITGRYALSGGPGGSITAALPGTSALGLKESEQIGGYPADMKDEMDLQLYKGIDEEGRGVVLDCGMFVLFNLYCPNETGPERLPYKMAYYKCLEERMQRLVQAGREVIIVGDINICRDEIDHPDPKKSMEENDLSAFKSHPARRWLDELLAPKGIFIDVGRHFHPTRRKMYTCWNTVIDARPVNYGARLDYTIISPGLMPWVKGADIQPDIYGSDHCPVYIELRDSLEIDGKTVYIKDLLNGGKTGVKPPPLACCNWSEFGSKQRKLASYFSGAARKSNGTGGSASGTQTISNGALAAPAGSSSNLIAVSKEAGTEAQAPLPTSGNSLADSLFDLVADSRDVDDEILPSLKPLLHTASPIKSSSPGASQPVPQMRTLPAPRSPSLAPSASFSTTAASNGKAIEKETEAARATKMKKKAGGRAASTGKTMSKSTSVGQLKMTSFLSGPKRKLTEPPVNAERQRSQEVVLTDAAGTLKIPAAGVEEDESSRDQAAAQKEAQEGAVADSNGAEMTGSPDRDDTLTRFNAAMAWGQIFTPPTAPLCSLHHEPAKAWTVNKSGPNHGRKFWLCNRPIGPGHEGSGVPRDQVNPALRCDFFLWESDRQKNSARAKAAKNGSSSSSSMGARGNSSSPTKAFGEVGRQQRDLEAERRKNEEPRPHKRMKGA